MGPRLVGSQSSKAQCWHEAAGSDSTGCWGAGGQSAGHCSRFSCFSQSDGPGGCPPRQGLGLYILPFWSCDLWGHCRGGPSGYSKACRGMGDEGLARGDDWPCGSPPLTPKRSCWN